MDNKSNHALSPLLSCIELSTDSATERLIWVRSGRGMVSLALIESIDSASEVVSIPECRVVIWLNQCASANHKRTLVTKQTPLGTRQ